MPSTIHRFTPPTCTLEIIGQKSFVRWHSKNLANKTRFKLKFDDPRQATSRQVTIQGSQADLLKLQTAIDSYVQTQLQSSFKLNNSHLITQSATEIDEGLPYLKPLGLIQHELFFGLLTHDSDRPKLKLGTVQLFDLVTALEAYQTKIAALSNTEAKSRERVIPLWGIAAVAIAIVSVAVANLLKPQPQTNIASDRSQPESTPVVPESSEITPPATPESDRQFNPKLDEPIASTKRLPPPPAVETPKPKPDIPDPADYPLSQVGRQTGLDNSVARNSVKQKISQPQSTEAGTEILPEASPEVINPPATNLNRQKLESDVESDFSASDTVRATEDLAVRSSPTQLSQTREIIAYFKNNWQPPEDIKQSLEYRLFVAPDGSIQRVIPLGKAARIYLGTTKIPVDGKPFISPVATDRTATIRVLLNPDGKVQAFEE